MLEVGTRVRTLIDADFDINGGFEFIGAGNLGTIEHVYSDTLITVLLDDGGSGYCYEATELEVVDTAPAPPTLAQQLAAANTEIARLRAALVEIAAAGPVMGPRMSQYVNRDACMIATGKWELAGMARAALAAAEMAVEDKAVGDE